MEFFVGIISLKYVQLSPVTSKNPDRVQGPGFLHDPNAKCDKLENFSHWELTVNGGSFRNSEH